MLRTAALLALLATSAGEAAPPARASAGATVVYLRTPSGNIGCGAYRDSRGATLRCDIATGLRPRPPRPRGCEFDWGSSFVMAARGSARVTCASDSVLAAPAARVLRYGTTWRRFGFACTSRRSGLRCVNAAGHGFFLSRQRSYRF